jgi:hypothetical protein
MFYKCNYQGDRGKTVAHMGHTHSYVSVQRRRWFLNHCLKWYIYICITLDILFNMNSMTQGNYSQETKLNGKGYLIISVVINPQPIYNQT